MLIVTLVLITSKAKYKNIESINLASGTINYTPADIDIVAIYQENDSGEYESTETIPSSGYTLSNTSYCNVNGVKDNNVVLTYQNGKVGASNITKKIKCYLYFDKYRAIDKIIGDTTGIEEKTEFTGIADSSDTGIYSAPDDYGTSYYFRGLEGSLNNWVKFADSYWRIIRVNGNGTVRMIYSGIASGLPSSSNKRGSTTQIEYSMYNSIFADNAYVGYMTGIQSSNSSSYNSAHMNKYNSEAKTIIDNWYVSNILNNENYTKYIDSNTGFCNDRELSNGTLGYEGEGYGTQRTAYAPLGRLYNRNSGWKTVQTPTLQCSNKLRDLFTTNTSDLGNKELTHPIGLITSDEVVFAGGFGGSGNTTYYLYTNLYYWTMSPYYYGSSYARMFRVPNNGAVDSASVHDSSGFRPVINLRSDTQFTGEGSESNPFIVV